MGIMPSQAATKYPSGHTFVKLRRGFGSQDYVQWALNPRLPVEVKIVQICL